MRKIIAISLVAILAVGSVFAAFSGSATVGLGADFDKGLYGFIGNGTNVKFNIDLASASEEAIAEGDVYASVKASLGLFLLNDADGGSAGDPYTFIASKGDGSEGGAALALKAAIDEAKIAGANWYVSLLGVPSVNDFAKSAIDTWTVENEADDYGVLKADYDKNATYKVGYTKAPGVEVGVYDYVVGAGFKAKAVQNPKFNAFDQYALSLYGKTPEYDFEGFKLQVGASYATSKAPIDFVGNDKVLDQNALGGSVKFGFANDTISASVASDLGYDFKGNKFGADVAANFAYGEVAVVDAYYATAAVVDADDTSVDNLLSVQVSSDLNQFKAPVKLTFTAIDLVNTQDLTLKAEVAISAVTLTPSVGYVVDTNTFKAGIEAKYAQEDFTVKGAFNAETVGFKGTPVLGASASVESATLIPGAEVKLAWSDAKDLLQKDNDGIKEFGKIVASVKVSF